MENTTVSFSLALTAIGKDVTSPSGTSSPQASSILVAPYSLKISPASLACSMYNALFSVGTATAKASIYDMR